MQFSKKYYIEIGILFLILLFFFLINNNTWYGMDDLFYKYFISGQFTPENSPEIKSIPQFFISQKNHYLIMNGRITPHFLIQLIMQFNKTIFNIFNTIIFFLLSFLITSIAIKLADSKTTNNCFSVFLIFSLFLLFMQTPEMTLTFFWMSGAINYLWGAFFGLLLARLLLSSKNNYFLIILLSFIVGNYSENNGPGFILFSSVIYILYTLKKENRFLIIKPIISIISGSIGFVILMVAPRTAHRTNYEINFHNIINNMAQISSMLIESNLYIYIILALLIFLSLKTKTINKNDIIICLIILICHLFTVLPLIFSTEIYYRSFFGSQVILYIALIYMLRLNVSIFNFIKQLKDKILIFFICLLCLSFWQTFNSSKEVKIQTNAIIENIMTQKKQKKTDISVPNYINLFPNKRVYIQPISVYKSNYVNIWLAKYYGVDSIVASDEKTLILKDKRFKYHNIIQKDDSDDKNRWRVK